MPLVRGYVPVADETTRTLSADRSDGCARGRAGAPKRQSARRVGNGHRLEGEHPALQLHENDLALVREAVELTAPIRQPEHVGPSEVAPVASQRTRAWIDLDEAVRAA